MLTEFLPWKQALQNAALPFPEAKRQSLTWSLARGRPIIVPDGQVLWPLGHLVQRLGLGPQVRARATNPDILCCYLAILLQVQEAGQDRGSSRPVTCLVGPNTTGAVILLQLLEVITQMQVVWKGNPSQWDDHFQLDGVPAAWLCDESCRGCGCLRHPFTVGIGIYAAPGLCDSAARQGHPGSTTHVSSHGIHCSSRAGNNNEEVVRSHTPHPFPEAPRDLKSPKHAPKRPAAAPSPGHVCSKYNSSRCRKGARRWRGGGISCRGRPRRLRRLRRSWAPRRRRPRRPAWSRPRAGRGSGTRCRSRATAATSARRPVAAGRRNCRHRMHALYACWCMQSVKKPVIACMPFKPRNAGRGAENNTVTACMPSMPAGAGCPSKAGHASRASQQTRLQRKG